MLAIVIVEERLMQTIADAYIVVDYTYIILHIYNIALRYIIT